MSNKYFNEIVADFELLEEWEDRYRYIIDLGKNLQPMEESKKNSENKVEGCASQVWLEQLIVADGSKKLIQLAGDSDALIVRGLIAILVILYNGESLENGKLIQPLEEFNKLGLNQHLSSQRANGLRSMVDNVQEFIRAS